MRAMNECRHATAVLEAVVAGHWPERANDELRSHVSACASCAELVDLSAALSVEAGRLEVEASLPTAGAMWWRMQARQRAESARVAERPIAVVQLLALASGHRRSRRERSRADRLAGTAGPRRAGASAVVGEPRGRARALGRARAIESADRDGGCAVGDPAAARALFRDGRGLTAGPGIWQRSGCPADQLPTPNSANGNSRPDLASSRLLACLEVGGWKLDVDPVQRQTSSTSSPARSAL